MRLARQFQQFGGIFGAGKRVDAPPQLGFVHLPARRRAASSCTLPIIAGTLAVISGAFGSQGWMGRDLPSTTGRRVQRQVSAHRIRNLVDRLDHLEQALRRHLLQLLHLVRLEVQGRHHVARGLVSGFARDGPDRRSAFRDGAVKEALGGRHGHQRADLHAAAGLPKDGDVAGIAAHVADVVAHPFEREHEIEHAGVARFGETRAAEFGEVEVAEDVEAVIHGNHDHVVIARQVGAVGLRARARAGAKAAAVEPDHHRPLAVVAERRGPHVEHQAVFTHGLLSGWRTRWPGGSAMRAGRNRARP